MGVSTTSGGLPCSVDVCGDALLVLVGARKSALYALCVPTAGRCVTVRVLYQFGPHALCTLPHRICRRAGRRIWDRMVLTVSSICRVSHLFASPHLPLDFIDVKRDCLRDDSPHLFWGFFEYLNLTYKCIPFLDAGAMPSRAAVLALHECCPTDLG